MVEMTITQLVRKPSELKKLLEDGKKVRILYKEPKPNGEVQLSAIIQREQLS
jgi:hypothetical protein